MKTTLKKLTCAVLATVSALGCAATLTACTTDHPEVEMQIVFNDETYTLEYKLYRKTAPATVEHFLYLADNDYYDGLCVHDYVADDRLYTGEYEAGEAGSLTHKNYFETIKTFDNYDKFPHSVWENKGKENATYTLKGEFNDNGGFDVESGLLGESFGSLSMYYYAAPSSVEKKVQVINGTDKNETDRRDYKYNLTTSAFFISLKKTKPSNSGYCTFATLDSKSRSTLEELQAAIQEYVDTHHAEDAANFTHTVTQKVFEYDPFLKDYNKTQEFSTPKEPIVIKKVSVKKY